jgi:hypothetical protein
VSSLPGNGLRLLALGLGCLGLTATPILPQMRAEPAESMLQIALTPARESFSLHEPIQVALEIRSGSDGSFSLDLGSNAKGSLTFSFVRPDGQRVSSRLPQPVEDFSVSGTVNLTPGQVYRETLVLNEWNSFDQVGDYQIEVAVPAPQEERSAPIGVRVTPRDPDRLKSACEKLEATILHAKPDQVREAAHALSFAFDEACVPSLTKVLKESFLGRDDAIQGLAKLRTAAAIAAMVEVWEGLDDHARRRLMSELNFVGSGELLRDALQRAGKKAGKP